MTWIASAPSGPKTEQVEFDFSFGASLERNQGWRESNSDGPPSKEWRLVADVLRQFTFAPIVMLT
jgi:hypothetical protein